MVHSCRVLRGNCRSGGLLIDAAISRASEPLSASGRGSWSSARLPPGTPRRRTLKSLIHMRTLIRALAVVLVFTTKVTKDSLASRTRRISWFSNSANSAQHCRALRFTGVPDPIEELRRQLYAELRNLTPRPFQRSFADLRTRTSSFRRNVALF